MRFWFNMIFHPCVILSGLTFTLFKFHVNKIVNGYWIDIYTISTNILENFSVNVNNIRVQCNTNKQQYLVFIQVCNRISYEKARFLETSKEVLYILHFYLPKILYK